MAGRDTRSVLWVAYSYPPDTNAGAHRSVAMTKYLRRLGYDVTILTTSAYGELKDDGAQNVERAYDLQLARARLAGRERMEPVFDAGSYTNRPHPLSYVIPPEPSVLAWAPFALARARRLHRAAPFDCVVTSSPLESAHVIGWSLRRMGVPWVAELRDGWVFESLRPDWQPPLRGLDRWIERRTLGAANAVVTVSEPIAADLRSRVRIPALVVPNGWDPELGAAAARHRRDAEALLDPARVSILHAGRMEANDRDPRPLVDALVRLARSDPDCARRVELVFAGPLTEGEQRLLAADVAPGRIVAAGSLPRERALALQASADVLLVITSGLRRSEATGKLFEYLAAEKPILALATAGNETARILGETGGGVVIPPNDSRAAEDALRALVERRPRPASPERTRAYRYPAVAEAMAAQIESVCT